MLAHEARHYPVRTEVFDGPLALLLHLVRQQGVDVRELRIAPITDAYLEHLAAARAMNLDLAGEFLVMAATLCWLKSRELLPRTDEEPDEDEGDPDAIREELLRRIVEYRRYAEAAARLAERPWLGRDVFARPPSPVDEAERPLVPGTDAMGLAAAFHGVLERAAAPPPLHEVARQRRSLREVAAWLLDRVGGGDERLDALLAELDDPADKVLAFFSSLELARAGFIDIEQPHHLGPITVRLRGAADDDALDRLAGEAG